MKPERQYQVRLNGNLIFQSDSPIEANNSIVCTIYNTLKFSGIEYQKEWKEELQGDFICDVLEICSF